MSPPPRLTLIDCDAGAVTRFYDIGAAARRILVLAAGRQLEPVRKGVACWDGSDTFQAAFIHGKGDSFAFATLALPHAEIARLESWLTPRRQGSAQRAAA